MVEPLKTDSLYCPQCGYDLRGQTLQRCPECGFHYDRPGLEYLADKAVQRCLAPLLDAINVLLVGVLLSTMALLPLAAPKPYRIFLPHGFLVVALLGAWLLMFARGLLLDHIRSSPPRVFETAADSIGECLSRPRLAILWAAACFLQFLCASEKAFLLITGCVFGVGLAWVALGLARIKDLPAHEDHPALAPERLAALTRARRVALILAVLGFCIWVVLAQLLY